MIVELLKKYVGKPRSEWSDDDLEALMDNGYYVYDIPGGTRIAKGLVDNSYSNPGEKQQGDQPFPSFSVTIPKHEIRFDPNVLQTIDMVLNDFSYTLDEDIPMMDHGHDAFFDSALFLRDKYGITPDQISPDISLELDDKTFEQLIVQEFEFTNIRKKFMKYSGEYLSDHSSLVWAYDEGYDVDAALKNIFHHAKKGMAYLDDRNQMVSDYHRSIREFDNEFGAGFFTERLLSFLKDKYDIKIPAKESLAATGKAIRKYNIKEHPICKKEMELRKDKNSEEYMEVKKQQTELKSDLRMVADHFNPNFEVFKSYRSTLKRLTKLVNQLYGESGSVSIKVDASYQPGIDARAGEVSGDCTIGSPLPFNHPYVHNAKLYLNNKNIGNIYLLEDRSNRVLHMEAFQCPDFTKETTINFLNDFLPKLKSAYESAQKLNDVSITVNLEDHLRSDYKDISEAINHIWEKNGQAGLIKSVDGGRQFWYPACLGYFQGGNPGELDDKMVIFE